MDHLPWPDKSKPSSLEIPYFGKPLSGSEADNVNEYPSCTSLRDFLSDAPPADEYWVAQDPDNIPYKAQATLYFGLLRDLFGVSFNMDDFLLDSPNGRIVTMKRLERLVREAVDNGDVDRDHVIQQCLKARRYAEPIRVISPDCNKTFCRSTCLPGRWAWCSNLRFA